jgi:murein DD-endopeptidase MepM/ murein hydrolase activator NlpD
MIRYSVLVIPENHLESKRFHVSKFGVHLGILTLVLLIGFTTVMTWGFIHYRQVARMASNSISPFEESNHTQLLSKINTLEESLHRTQQFASRMESMIGVDAGKMKMGVGPLSEHDDFSKYLDKISKLPKPGDTAYFSDSHDFKEPQNFYDRLSFKVEELSEFALSLETRVNEVYELGQDKLSYWASTPSIWPVRGWVTSDFGARISPLSGLPKFHEGIDIAAPYGTSIFAPADGIVSFTGYKGGYGYALMIDHGYGLSTLYGHTSNIFAKEGQRVKRGQLIASVGSSGAATGPHLHYEVHVDGIPTDPLRFVLR